MKDPKALFPLLFASSWLGNLLLTILAFYLAFSHDGPLTPLIFLTVALCILSGNALPIGVYLIMVRWRAIELKAESTEVALRVRDGLMRTEELMGRLDEAEGALAKGILVARQVPERIGESLESLLELGGKLETMEVNCFTEAIQGQSESLGSVKVAVEELAREVKLLEKEVATIGKDVRGFPGELSKVVEDLPSAQATPANAGDEVSLSERLDLLFEALESVQDSQDSLLQRVAEIRRQTAAPARMEEPKPVADDVLEQPPVEEDDPEPEVEPVEDDGPEEEEEEVFADDPEEFEPEEEEVVDEEEPAEEDEPFDEPEAELEFDHEEDDFQLSDGRTRLVAHAMIGMRNKLYIRGDEPWLSWEDGQVMELIGIGEFAWSMDDLKEPIEVTVLLNDELEAKGGAVTLPPGKTVRISPTFPAG
ncbi:MAG: hypothetical protein ACO3ZW_03780 [Opitutales bacterium]|jgi:hypothetical protein